MNAGQHTIDNLVWTLCPAAQNVKIAMILLHYWRVERRAELFVRDSRSPLNVASGENQTSQCLLVSYRQVLTTRGIEDVDWSEGEWLCRISKWKTRMLTKSHVGELRKKTKSKQIAICMCYYFGLRHLFLFARLGEPHSFYTSRGHQYLWSQMGHFHQLNTRLADCHICSAVPHRERQTSIHMFTRLVCNLVCRPLVLHSKVESSELPILFNQGRGVFLLNINE